MDPEYSFGQWIRKRRKYLGLTQEALAEKVGYSAAMMRKIENDERRPSSSGASLLAEALDIPQPQQSTFLEVARQERAADRLGRANQEEHFPWASDLQPRTNLPVPATLFVGREDELATLNRLLVDPVCRMITLVGLAGIGKTRLAVQAAQAQLDRFAQGVFFVPLASLSSHKMIVSAVANAVGLQFQGAADPYEQLLRYLQPKNMLLVLDNFEHLMEGEKLLSAILQRAPAIQLLVTSRERLNLQGEWVVEVKGLDYPPGSETGGFEQAEVYEAVQLFMQSALRVHPGFSLDEENRKWVIRICQLMEGLPLGIELASAWVRALSCQTIVKEIETSLDFLKAFGRDVPERHRSLRSALDHSWNLLSAREKLVLQRLSVFRGGLSWAAAQVVAEARLDEITTLLDKSLLKRVGEERYDLHDLVRQYAAVHLASDEQEQTRTQERHSSYYVSLLDEWRKGIRGPRQIEIFAEMDAEMDNVRLAWQWILAHQQLKGIRIALDSLRHYYEIRARFQEGVELFREAAAALEKAGNTDGNHGAERDVVLGQLLVREGYFQVRQDHYEEATEVLQRSLALLRSGSDQLALADTLSVLAYKDSRVGQFTEAMQFAGESLTLNRALGNQVGIAFCLRTLAQSCLALGAFEEAYQYSNESLSICREFLGDPHGTAICLATLSSAARYLGKFDEARSWAEEGVSISKAVNDRWCLAQTQCQLGLAYKELREYSLAEELIHQSIEPSRETADRLLLGSVLIALGVVNRESGAQDRSKQHFLQALQMAAETKTIPISLEALTELAINAMSEGDNELALELAVNAMQHTLLNARLKARLDELYTTLKARVTQRKVEKIEKLAEVQTFENFLQAFLTERVEE